MPLDPVLAQGVAPINFAGPDPATKMNQLAAMMKMQGLQQEGQLNALKLTEAQKQAAEVDAMKDAIRRGDDLLDPRNAAKYGSSGLAFHKALRESQNADLDNRTKLVTAGRDIWAGVRDQASYDAARPQLEALRPGSTASLPRAFDPTLVEQNLMDAKTYFEVNKPQTTLGKLQAELAQFPPNDPRRPAYEAAINKETRFAPTDASQLPADARMIEWLKLQDPDTQALYRQMFGKGDTGKVAQVITDNAGNVRMFTASGEEVIPKTAAGAPPPKGKPSATFEKTTAQRKQLALDLDRAITELSTAAEDGGLIDQSTGSGLGQLADTAAGVIGQATPGAIAISKLQPIADLVLSDRVSRGEIEVSFDSGNKTIVLKPRGEVVQVVAQAV
jgi:hypothetical protein